MPSVKKKKGSGIKTKIALGATATAAYLALGILPHLLGTGKKKQKKKK